ncbi:MAG: YafY family protein [Pseudomonadota bacterium]
MRRSERLSDLIDIVRDGRLHRARDLADQLEVCERTIYRDIDTLVANGVPIEGERGVGYLLREPVFLPPLALSVTELEALSLGMSLVQEIADPELQAAAKTLHTKIASHAPNRKKTPEAWGFGLYAFERLRSGLTHMPVLRSAIRAKAKLEIAYRSLDETTSTRIIRPLQTDYWGKVWTLTSWCELRLDFRAFRVDRITSCRETGGSFQNEPGKRIEDYFARVKGEMDGDSNHADPDINDVPRP